MKFWAAWQPAIDVVIPVPPSNVSRQSQPVITVAAALARRLQVPLYTKTLSKIKNTPELKDVFGYDERMEAFEGAFSVSSEKTAGKSILLFDDLYSALSIWICGWWACSTAALANGWSSIRREIVQNSSQWRDGIPSDIYRYRRAVSRLCRRLGLPKGASLHVASTGFAVSTLPFGQLPGTPEPVAAQTDILLGDLHHEYFRESSAMSSKYLAY